MHWYKKNIGDYAKKAARLSMLQHGAYAQLMDACYDREKFPTKDEAIAWLWASSPEEIAAVEFVLTKFFVLNEDGYYEQSRMKQEIEKYQANCVTNKRVAIEREANRKPKKPKPKGKTTKRARTVNEAPPNQELGTKNQEPETENQTSPPNPPEGACSADEKNISVIEQINQATRDVVNQSSGSPLPDNFELRTETLEALLELHKIPDKFVIEQWSEFVIYWSDHRGGRISWDSTFFKRCIHQWKLHGPRWLKLEEGSDDEASQDRGSRENGWNGSGWGDGVDLSEVYQPDGHQIDQQTIPESSRDLPSVEASV